MPIRIVIADDHPIVLGGLRNLIADQPDMQVVATCPNGAEAIAAVAREHPDILLIDLKMAGLSGLEVLNTVRTLHPHCRTLLLTAAIRDDEAAQAIALGVSGILLKESPSATVFDSIRTVAAGGTWIDPERFAPAIALAQGDGTPAASLTRRELEIIHLVAEGLRNKEIGERLSITEGTVKIHLHHIYNKLGVDGRLELVLAAQHRGIV